MGETEIFDTEIYYDDPETLELELGYVHRLVIELEDLLRQAIDGLPFQDAARAILER